MRRLVLPALLACLAASIFAFACSRDEPEAPSAVPAATAGAPAPPPASSLAPIIASNGGPDRLPDAVVIQLARPVAFAREEDGSLSEDTVLELDPDVDGILEVTGPSTLTFRATEGFAPATQYSVTLESLATVDGTIEPDEGAPWTATFTTAPFRFVAATQASLDREARKATIEIRFSGSVDVDQAKREIEFTGASGDELRASFDAPPEDLRVVLATLEGAAIVPGAAVEMRIGRGVRLHPGPRAVAPEASARFELREEPNAPQVTIRSAHPGEGTNGWFVEIVCDDQAVKERHWYWDPVSQEGYGEISLRCRLDEREVAEKLSFDPPVAFTTAPSGAGLRIFGDFRRGSYQLRLQPGVHTADGGIVRLSHETTLSVPARSSRVSFTGKGRYLPRDQWRSLPFRHVNVDAVDVVIRHVRPENLVFWASSESEAATQRESDVIAQARIPVKSEPDRMTTSWLDAASLVPAATRGLLEIGLSAGEASDTARLVLTDIQLVAKREAGPRGSNQGGEIRAWAFDASTLQALSGVQLDLVRPSGQVVASATTDGTGEARLAVRTPSLPQEPPFAILARKDKDVTYLAFDEVQAEVDDEHVGGEAVAADVPWRAALFTDRGVYRPGETAHATALVRDGAYGPAPKDMPVVLRLVDPRGRVLREAPLTLSAAGFATLDVAFADFATTGRHELQLDVADARVATRTFHVEEFVPERMEVKVVPKAAEALAGEPVTVDVSARYLFGGVPADHQAELTCTIETGGAGAAGAAGGVDGAGGSVAPGYRFGPWSEEGAAPKTMTLGRVSAALDQDGRTELACPGREGSGLGGSGRLIASVAVFESGGGRTTVGQAAVTVHPERFLLGLATRSAEARGGEPIVVDGVVVDWQGKPSSGATEVELQLLRLEREYGWYFDEDLGHSTHRSYLRSVPEGSSKVKVTNGKFQAQLVPAGDSAGYLVRAVAGRARTELHVPGSWSDGWWDEWQPGRVADRTPRPGKPAWLSIDVPEIARVGSRIDVSLNAPHRGRLLMTAEADRVLARQWRDVEAGPVTWSFELEEMQPNVYVAALLVKPPHLESKESFVPDRAYGVASIPVEPTAALLPVKLGVPDEVRSGAPLTVTVDVGKNAADAQVVIAAVDEGILSLTKFRTPDPIAEIFTRRALGVSTYETVGWTLLSSPPPPSGAGSGDEMLALGRVQSIKPVALWSGLVDVGADGKASVTFDVPTYRGKLRVMAVAATPKRMGSASAPVIVRDPLTLQVTLPRFLVKDDVAQVPVFVTNLSGSRRSVDVSLTAEPLDAGGLTSAAEAPELVAIAGTSKTLQLADAESGTALFTLRVRGSSGAVRLTARAVSGDLRSHDETEVPLLPTGPRTREVKRIEIAEGETSLTAALAGWEPMSERSTIRVTSNPYGDAFDHLGYLVRYPYGCIEQTVSSSRPLLAMQHLVQDVDPKLVARGSIEDMVRKGIERILSMQLPAGGFSYWPGGREEAYWGTAYGVHFLLDAKQAGYAVPQARLDAALAWMEDRVTNHYEKGRQHGDWYSENAEPYIHLVLARGGRARPARAEALLREVPGRGEGQRAENRFMLQAALWLSGDRRHEKELRAVDLAPIAKDRLNDWSFYSDGRRRGFVLATHVDLFGSDEAANALGNVVADSLRGKASTYYTTQELVWSIAGLGKLVGVTASFDPPSLTAGGIAIAPAPKSPGSSSSERTWELTRASERGDVTVTVPRKGEGRLFAIVSSEGVRTGAVAQSGSEGLRVERAFVDGSGAPIDVTGAPVALGDLVHVVLTIGNVSGARIANVALVDRVPAGFEIENPRLGRQAAIDWLPQEELWDAEHLDVRDDRLEVFGHLDAGQSRKIAYAVRAVTQGRFTLPPAEAEAMYDPSLWARHPGGTVHVAGPWPVAQ